MQNCVFDIQMLHFSMYDYQKLEWFKVEFKKRKLNNKMLNLW